MSLVSLQAITKQYSERLLLEQATLLIQEGDRIGLIGVNGSGKTTLLRIVAGLELPDQGEIVVRGATRIEYLAQDPILDDHQTVLDQIFHSQSDQMQLLREYERVTELLQRAPQDDALQQRLMALSAEMDRTGGWSAESNAKAVLTQLGITDFAALVGTLSGGQRKRVALARALIDRADLLILDEPTNHIDADTVAWLEEYLATTPGALLMVTHDRYFLDRVVNRIVELDRRQLVVYSGNYAQYLEQRAARQERLVADEEKHRNLLRRELAWLRRGAMARSTKQKARKERVAELQRLRYDSGEETVAITLATRRLGNQVLQIQGLAMAYGAAPLFSDIDFELRPGDRIGMIGPNGAGKSTFLDILAGKCQPTAGQVTWGETVEVGYFDQRSLQLDGSMRLLDYIEQEAPLIRTRDGEQVEAAHILEWFLFPRKMQWGRIDSLSGGERRRLYLLRTLVHRPNVLLLDEPTNDLDIQTLTVLEQFLDHFQGALLVVSHDRYFLDRTVDYLIHFEAGAVSPRYPTPYTTFRRLFSEAGGVPRPAPAAAGAPPTAPANGSPTRRPARLTWKEERELELLERRSQELEAEQALLQQAVNAAGGDYVRLQSLAAELAAVEAELDDVLTRWVGLAERMG